MTSKHYAGACLAFGAALLGIVAPGTASAYSFEVIYDPYKEYFDQMFPGEGLTSELEAVTLYVEPQVLARRRFSISAATVPSVRLDDGPTGSEYLTPWFGMYLFRSDQWACLADYCDGLGLDPGDPVMVFKYVFDGFAFTGLRFGRYLRGSRLSTDSGSGEWSMSFRGGPGNLWISEYWYDDGLPNCSGVRIPGFATCGGVVGRFVLDGDTVPPVEEPGTLALLGLGLAGLAASRRRGRT